MTHDSADLRKRSSSFDILRKLLLVHLNVDARLTRCIYVIAIYIYAPRGEVGPTSTGTVAMHLEPFAHHRQRCATGMATYLCVCVGTGSAQI